MTFDEMVAARRSIRRYLPTPVPGDALRAVLEAGRLAPSASNKQNWHFTVVKNDALRARLVEACSGQEMVRSAPLALVVWHDVPHTMRCGQSVAAVDCSIALSFMMLKAVELGLGTCWLGAFFQERVKQALQLPAAADVVAVMPLGYADEAPAPRPRKGLDEIIDIRE